MNDLFSSSFKNYTDLKQYMSQDEDDLEAGRESLNLDIFFEDVENVKTEMKNIEMLYKKLQEANEETKITHNSKTMKEVHARMDSDVQQVLKRVKLIKDKLSALELSNADSRNIPGCGPGSSADRTRTLVVSGLGKRLKYLMDNFESLRTRMQVEYKETVERRYFTITGQKADEETIEKLISSGESESFLQKAIQEQGKGEILETIFEIQERHDAIKEIEKNLVEVHDVFLDMDALVEAQGHQLIDIESHVARGNSFVRRGTRELEEARQLEKSSWQWTCVAIVAALVLILVILLPLLPSLVFERR